MARKKKHPAKPNAVHLFGPAFHYQDKEIQKLRQWALEHGLYPFIKDDGYFAALYRRTCE